MSPPHFTKSVKLTNIHISLKKIYINITFLKHPTHIDTDTHTDMHAHTHTHAQTHPSTHTQICGSAERGMQQV